MIAISLSKFVWIASVLLEPVGYVLQLICLVWFNCRLFRLLEYCLVLFVFLSGFVWPFGLIFPCAFTSGTGDGSCLTFVYPVLLVAQLIELWLLGIRDWVVSVQPMIELFWIKQEVIWAFLGLIADFGRLNWVIDCPSGGGCYDCGSHYV